MHPESLSDLVPAAIRVRVRVRVPAAALYQTLRRACTESRHREQAQSKFSWSNETDEERPKQYKQPQRAQTCSISSHDLTDRHLTTSLAIWRHAPCNHTAESLSELMPLRRSALENCAVHQQHQQHQLCLWRNPFGTHNNCSLTAPSHTATTAPGEISRGEWKQAMSSSCSCKHHLPFLGHFLQINLHLLFVAL